MSAATATGSTGRYAGASAEERRGERRRRLLEAALDLLGTEGWGATTVRGVCARAELNPRYFYESFEDLDALLVAMFDGVVADTTREILCAFEAAEETPHAKAHATVAAMVRYVTDDPRRARVLFVEALGNEALARRRVEAMHSMSELIVLSARMFYGREGDRDPIAYMTAEMLVGGLASLLISWLDGRLEVSRDRLIDDTAELFVVTGEGAVAIASRRGQR